MEEILDQRGNIWGYRNYFLPQIHQIYHYIQFFLKEIQKLAMWLLHIRWTRKKYIKIGKKGTSLELQWLRTQLPMQETWVRSLFWGDPICPGAAKPLKSQPPSPCSRAGEPQLRSPRATTMKPLCLEPVHSNKRNHQNKKERDRKATATKNLCTTTRE